LTPYPIENIGCKPQALGCACCVFAHCVTPEPGQACDSTDTWLATRPFRVERANPTCSAQPAGNDLAGPFAPNHSDTPISAGECCYLMGILTCVGRPLVVAGELVLAAVIARSDWMA
ncbi:MAG TPA: hypothetical protein VMF89_06630, partial [Polyangiales bacterium]|nr:hypothetical protein [Polyangiales bacterium]